MPALERIKRNKPAKFFAEKMGVSVRTVKRYISQPREDYEKEAKDRRKTAYNLHFNNGLKWKEVAEKMNATEDAVKALAKRYKQIEQESRG